MRTRLAVGVLGVAVAAFGAWQLLAAGWPDLGWIALWLGGGVVVHDALLVPLTIAATVAGRRVLPVRLRRKVTLALVVLFSVTVTAIPVLGGWGRRTDNPTLLDRNYVAGWIGFAALVLLGALSWVWLPRLRRTQQGR